tara:strand:+ start:1130 stop:1441 length:312 start_codon:yes stop_codon:yes gene_type:complete
MSRNLVRPFFPIPPKEYSSKYFDEVVRSFSVYLDQMQNPGEGRNTGIVLTNLQKSDQGLEVGELFEYRNAAGDMGYVKITTADQTNLLGMSSTGLVGAVTVTT